MIGTSIILTATMILVFIVAITSKEGERNAQRKNKSRVPKRLYKNKRKYERKTYR